MATKIQMKRVYEAPAASDGFRVLVDRLWPQGLTKAQAAHNQADVLFDMLQTAVSRA